MKCHPSSCDRHRSEINIGDNLKKVYIRFLTFIILWDSRAKNRVFVLCCDCDVTVTTPQHRYSFIRYSSATLTFAMCAIVARHTVTPIYDHVSLLIVVITVYCTRCSIDTRVRLADRVFDWCNKKRATHKKLLRTNARKLCASRMCNN